MTTETLPQLLLLACSLPPAACSVYLAILTIAACINPRRSEISGVFSGARKCPARFIVLIPAHNEETMIADTLQRLARLEYPNEQFEIVVVADNCSDATADICRELDCTLLERRDSANQGKGQALNWAMTKHLSKWPRQFDAVLVLDADSRLNADFLRFMSDRVRRGNDILQGYYTVSNPAESWRTSLLTASLALFHFLRPLGRDRLGLPCGIKGNGFVLSRRLVLEYGYPAESNVEDVELALFYVLRGIGAMFVPGAHVYGQMTSRADAAAQQRARWEGGRIDILRNWARPLLKTAIAQSSLASFDALIDLLIPPFALLAIGTAFMLATTGLAASLHPAALTVAAFALTILAAMLQFTYTLAGLILSHPPACVWRRMLFAPLYIAWKLPLYIRMMRRPSCRRQWKRTARVPPNP